MPESVLALNVIDLVENCIRKAALASKVEHHGLAGDIREIFLSDLLIPLLPQDFKIGTGKIIDRKGELSQQTDIIIYNRKRFPAIMFDSKKGIFPIDSVYYSIEVKTTVTATELKNTIEKAKTLRQLNGEQPNFVLFGFNTDVKTAQSDLARVSTYQTGFEKPPLNIYCNVDQGYCFYDKKEWKIHSNCKRHAEVIGLIIGIINTLVNSRLKAINVPPGKYLAWWNDEKPIPDSETRGKAGT